MQIVTGFEKYIVHQKLLVDVEIYQSRWSQGTYSCISELMNSKIKCLCPSCFQLNLLFNWTNCFKVEDGQKDTTWQICEYILSLIKKTHKGFLAAVDSSCNTDRLWVKLANNRLPTAHRAQKRHIQMVDSTLVNDETVTLNVTDDH